MLTVPYFFTTAVATIRISSVGHCAAKRCFHTFRARFAPLTRRGRALARKSVTLEYGMYLIGAVYNFCTAHQSLCTAATVRQPAVLSTPAMAARMTDHCWSLQELLSFHVPPPRWTPLRQCGRRS